MADPTDSPPCPTRKAALINAHPGQRYHPPVRQTSEQVCAEKEDIASKKAAADKAVQAQNESLHKLAMLNDKLTSEDIMYARQHAVPKKAPKSVAPKTTMGISSAAAGAQRKTQKKKVGTDIVPPATTEDPQSRPKKQKTMGMDPSAGETAACEGLLTRSAIAVVPDLPSGIDKPVDKPAVSESPKAAITTRPTKSLPAPRPVQVVEIASMANVLDTVTPNALLNQTSNRPGEQQEGGPPEGLVKYSERQSADLPPRRLPHRRTSLVSSEKNVLGSSATVESFAVGEGDSGESSGSEYQAPEGLGAMESSGEGSVTGESDLDGADKRKAKKKELGKRKGSNEGTFRRVAKKPKPSPVREAIQALQKNTSPNMVVSKRKGAPEPATEPCIGSKRTKPSLVQGMDRDWLKENVSKGAIKKSRTAASSFRAKANGLSLASKRVAEKGDASKSTLGGLEDEDPGATAASREAKGDANKGKGRRTIAAMGLKASVAVDTDAAIKKEAEDKPVQLQSMDDIPFRSADEYRTFDNTYVIAMLDWASTSDDPFGTNKRPQIDKILQKVWDELLPDNPLNVTDYPAIKKVIADRFNNHRSTISKIGRNVVKEHLQGKVDKDPKFDVSAYARRMAPRMKPFLFLYKDPETLTELQMQTGAFESEFICTVFAAHLRHVATSSFDFHMGNPVGALALSAVSVERAFKEYQRNEEGIANQKGLPFRSNEWGSPAVGWSAYVRKFSAAKWSKILATTTEYMKISGCSAVDMLQTHVDAYEERAMVELSDNSEGDTGNEFADVVGSEDEREGLDELGDEGRLGVESKGYEAVSDDEGSIAMLENGLSGGGLMLASDDEGGMHGEGNMVALDDEGSEAE
ncbi:hypothetical protein K488DRAFT_90234 [Vararia minispora EC-137]|uniref:Uncharacterized protein n=1 Tax=Vararia minispora EC-137 TaxID=1314806 RepID=A0ACB8Q8I3_9AGAM|nr:hypothetical protein K488DRAFT_90234 [Vararia minispora EC-137]